MLLQLLGVGDERVDRSGEQDGQPEHDDAPEDSAPDGAHAADHDRGQQQERGPVEAA